MGVIKVIVQYNLFNESHRSSALYYSHTLRETFHKRDEVILQIVRRMLSRDVPQRLDSFVADNSLFHCRQTFQRRQKTVDKLVSSNQLKK